MRKLAFVLLLVLGGCTNIQNAWNTLAGTTISPTTVYVAANSFDTVEATATNYLRLPPCVSGGSPVCRNQVIAAKVVSAIRKGRPIRNQLENLISAGQGNAPVPVTLYSALIAIISQAQQTLAGAPQ